jgi:DNA-binding GntR family transcriptional regulator
MLKTVISDHMSLPERVHYQLREQILNGLFRPGEMLRQEEIAQQLGVSRAPLREALPRLEAEGLIVLYPRRGYAVVSLDPDEISEIFDLRMLLEQGAAAVAARRRTAEDVAKARSIRREMASIDIKDVSKLTLWFDLHSKFHQTLFRPSGLKHYARLIANLRTIVEPYIRVETFLTGGLEEAEAEHDQLLDAFADGNSKSFTKLTGDHVRHTATRLLARLGESSPPKANAGARK